jgi:ankyrin repeat protein
MTIDIRFVPNPQANSDRNDRPSAYRAPNSVSGSSNRGIFSRGSRRGASDEEDKVKKCGVAAFCFSFLLIVSANAQTTDLFELAGTGTPQDVQAVIASGADVNAQDRSGWTALMYAAARNPDPEVTAVLLGAGADVKARNKNGMTALLAASVTNPAPGVIGAIVRAGADVNAQDKDGASALMFAASAASTKQGMEVIKTLIDAGANARARNKANWTVLMYAAVRNENLEVFSAILNAGVEINAQEDKNGWTALMIAARGNQSPAVINLLLKAGADARVKDGAGTTAVDYVKANAKLKDTAAYQQLLDAAN